MHGKFLALLLVFSLALVVDASKCIDCFEDNMDYSYKNIKNGTKTPGALACQELCQKTPGCKYFTWNKDDYFCWLKAEKVPHPNPNGISGPVRCDCFEDNIDYAYKNLNNGNKTLGPLECQELCQKLPGCKYFTWNKDDYFCWLKAEKVPHPNPNGISGPVRCDCFEDNIDYAYKNLNNGNMTIGPLECQELCQKLPGCKYFTWNKADYLCFLKAEKVPHPNPNGISGPVRCEEDP